MERTLLSYRTSDFPGCCGAGVIHDLTAATQEDCDEDVFFDLRYDTPKDISINIDEPMLLATTVPAQKGAIALLKKAKFRKLATWMGFHGNRITLWGKAKAKARARYK